MRKSAGISGLSRHTANTSSYASLSSSLSASQLTSLETSLASFREALLTFSRQHRDDIRADPAFRHQFTKMCSVLGVDPLSGPMTSKAGGGFWGGLGLGEWSYELCVQVVDVCVSTRGGNGGMIEMNDLIKRVGKMRGLETTTPTSVSMTAKPTGKQKDKEQTISREDITRAIGLLSPLAGYSVVSIGGVDFVRSVPRELDTDQSALLVIAATTGGRLTETHLRQSLGWNDVRARRAVEDSVMREGLGWVDDQGSQRAVWLIAAVEFEGQGLSGEL